MDDLTSGRRQSIKELADFEGLTGSYVIRVMRLAFLAPDIVEAILQGKQRPNLTAQALLRGVEIPLSWQDQRGRLGFPSPCPVPPKPATEKSGPIERTSLRNRPLRSTSTASTAAKPLTVPRARILIYYYVKSII